MRTQKVLPLQCNQRKSSSRGLDKIDKKERITIMIIVLVVAACCLAVVEAVEVSNKVNFMK